MNRIYKAIRNISRFILRLGLFRGLIAYLKIALFKRLPGNSERLIKLRIPGITAGVHLRPKTTDAHAFWQVFINGDYDFPVSKQPRFILDAGAHVGFATLYLQHRFPNARIVAIEPEPSNADVFAVNTREASNVVLHRAALWNSHKSLSIENPGGDSWSFRVQENDTESGGIPSITIPDILRETPTIDILKLDIEGAEQDLFSGDVEWLKQVGMIVIEFHERYSPGSTRMITDTVRQFGFEKIMEKGENGIFQAAEPQARPG